MSVALSVDCNCKRAILPRRYVAFDCCGSCYGFHGTGSVTSTLASIRGFDEKGESPVIWAWA